jgi:hypothetical protein
MPHMSKDHESWAANDGNHVMVPNPNEMISIVTPITKACVQVLECRAPKFLVDPLEGLGIWQCGRSWNLEHDPNFQH